MFLFALSKTRNYGTLFNGFIHNITFSAGVAYTSCKLVRVRHMLPVTGVTCGKQLNNAYVYLFKSVV